jgi:hypothetical protein
VRRLQLGQCDAQSPPRARVSGHGVALLRSLVALFSDHLRAGAPAGTRSALFAATLLANGYTIESCVLDRWDAWMVVPDRTGAPWAGRRVYVGRRAPVDAVVGELWLDTVEVVPMLRIELEAQGWARPARPGWMAIRPVARWQFLAFVAVAPLVGREVQLVPTLAPMDPRRLAGDEVAPITNITFAEAELYAWYFSKGVARQHTWRGAEACLGPAVDWLWHHGLAEFTGYGGQESERLRHTAARWREDPFEHDEQMSDRMQDDGPGDDDVDDDRMVVDELFHEASTGFRVAGDGATAIEPHARPPTMEPIALASGFPR